jgi:prepilin-type N-terminal cleavage/methylation domain-containing protein
MSSRAGKRGGFSLLELLCVMTLLSTVAGVLIVLLNETLALGHSQAEVAERSQRHRALADEFRADVARAEEAPAEWRQYRAGPQTLILRMKEGGHVLYQWEGDRLERRAFAAREEPARVLTAGDERVGVEFVREDAGLVRLRLLTLHRGSPLPGQALEITAALGGDWR